MRSLRLDSPVSLRHVLNLGGLFVIMEIVGTIGARFLGKFGFLALSLLGGMVSSASTTAAAATMAIHGKLSAEVAGAATVFASIASALAKSTARSAEGEPSVAASITCICLSS